MKRRLALLYEASMICLALMTILLFMLEQSGYLSQVALRVVAAIDSVVLVVFALDYFVRLAVAPRKGSFIRQNIPELVAILPFSSLFRAFRLTRVLRIVRLSRLTRFTKLARALSFGKIVADRFGRFLQTNGLIYMIYVTVMLVLLGGVAIYYAEGMESIQDAIWWSIVTATTVGYGDISPASGLGRLIAVVLMLSGIGLIGMVTGSIATYFLSSGGKPVSYRDEVIETIKKRLDDPASLSMEDVNYIHRVLTVLVEAGQAEEAKLPPEGSIRRSLDGANRSNQKGDESQSFSSPLPSLMNQSTEL